MYSTCLSLYSAAEGAVTTVSVGRRPSLASSLIMYLKVVVTLVVLGVMADTPSNAIMIRAAVVTAMAPAVAVSIARLHPRYCDVDFELDVCLLRTGSVSSLATSIGSVAGSVVSVTAASQMVASTIKFATVTTMGPHHAGPVAN